MLRLIHPTEPFWLDFGYGVRIQVLPFTSALMLAIRADLSSRIAALDPDAPELTDAQKGLMFNQSAARAAIIGWEGVCDADGNPAEVTQANVDALMAVWQIGDKFEALYIGPRMVLESEKNGSSPAPIGTSAGAQTTATTAAAPAASAPTP